MQNKFDELAKGLAQSVTRRQALKRFGIGLSGMALACFGLAGRAAAGTKRKGYCVVGPEQGVLPVYSGVCLDPATCQSGLGGDCHAGRFPGSVAGGVCVGYSIDPTKACVF